MLLACLTALASGSIWTALALAGGPTRTEYVDQLETICKPRAESTARVMRGVSGDIKSRRYKIAAAKFEHADRIFGQTVEAIAPVPRPEGDRSTLARWFEYLDHQERYLRQISTQLRAGNAVKVQHLTAAFIHTGNKANITTLAFGFNYCRFRFSRFS
ncbi:MAG TPA: hypothetical protein VG448_12625 [Solirubrobacterales bacterium]|nr:hypothetical protein [Solirubrobacterales bacterium]